jgi:hypothetical protein
MTGHRDSETGSDMAGTPLHRGPDVPLTVEHAEMNAAHERGEAAPLNSSIPWLVRYRDAWWVVYGDGWLRVVDGLGEIDIDHLSARLTAAEAGAARDTVPDTRASAETGT